jgi:hypothetical protein
MAKGILFLLFLLSLSGCYDTGYQPNYIISQEEFIEVLDLEILKR